MTTRTIEAGRLLRADTLILDGVAVYVESARRATVDDDGKEYVLIDYTAPGSYSTQRHFERVSAPVVVDLTWQGVRE